LINLSALWLSLSNTQQQTPAHKKESYHLLQTPEKMELATKLVGFYCEETSIYNKVVGTQPYATMEGTQVTATSTATTNLRQLTTSLKTVREAVLDAMQSQFYKIYHPMYGKAVIGGCSLPTKEKYDEVVASLLLGKSLSMLVMRILGQ
jgi:hypothetical protein